MMDENINKIESVEEIVIDFGDICRFCLQDTNNAVRISDNCFSEDTKNLTISTFVEKLTSIQIIDIDGFPSLVCENCVSLIKSIYDFISVCTRSQCELENSYKTTLEQTQAELVKHTEEPEIVIEEFEDVKKDLDLLHSIHNYSEKEIQSPVVETREIVVSENESLDDCVESFVDDYKTISCKITDNISEETKIEGTKGPFACQFCGKVYVFKNSLVSHIRKAHNAQLSEKCNYCSKSFHSKSTLNSHLGSEHRNLRVLCPYCSLHLNCQALEDHCLEFHKIKWQFSPPKKLVVKESQSGVTFTCEICDKVLQTKRSYQNHLKLHSGKDDDEEESEKKKEKKPKIFKCSMCDKEFKGKDTLNRHIRTHTNEKPFICEICSKGFYTKSEISRHVRYHRKDYRYICEICTKGFVDKTRFRHHIMAHKNVRPHKCPICQKEFILKGKMKIHLTRRHNVTMEESGTPKGQVDQDSYIPLHELLKV